MYTMHMACDECGAQKGHLGGCPAEDDTNYSRKVNKTNDNPGHTHIYICVGQTSHQMTDRKKKWIVTYRYLECVNTGCKFPYNTDIVRTRK